MVILLLEIVSGEDTRQFAQGNAMVYASVVQNSTQDTRQGDDDELG
jgi:hypothetical protein